MSYDLNLSITELTGKGKLETKVSILSDPGSFQVKQFFNCIFTYIFSFKVITTHISSFPKNFFTAPKFILKRFSLKHIHCQPFYVN